MEDERHVLSDLYDGLEDVVSHSEQEVDGQQPVEPEESLAGLQRNRQMPVNMKKR